MHPSVSCAAVLPVVMTDGADAEDQAQDLVQELATARAFRAASKAQATRTAYARDAAHFATFCGARGLCARPAEPETVCAYLSAEALRGLSVASIDRRAAAIAYAHRLVELDPPTSSLQVKATLQGIRNTLGRAPVKAQALTWDLVLQVVRRIPARELAGLRDRAMILLAFGAALRRSELVALDVEDLEFQRRGLLVRIGRSKTDQQGRGQSVAVPHGKLKVPAAVEAWISAATLTTGPVFRGVDRGRLLDRLSAGQFARVLKARAEAAGLDPSRIKGHSPRRGFATSAGDAGADLRTTARQMRHAKLETTMGYMEDGELFRAHAGAEFL